MRPEADKCFGKTLTWLKLSNSGDTLKLMIPSYSRKAISGQNNYLGMVTSHKMKETEMGYRGSKSEIVTDSVKEQRVDGSWSIKAKSKKMLLRCTLMGFERNYQIKIPSKQLNYFSILHSDNRLNPWFVTGLADSEGTFTIMIDQNQKRTLGWRVQAKFQIGLHERDLDLLLQVQQFFGGIGSIGQSGNMVFYSVSSVKDLTNTIIPHFLKYSLLTQKAADFLLFKAIVDLILNKVHLTIEGLNKIINIKASMNTGLSQIVKSKFSHIEPVNRPLINTDNIPDPQWITGFVNGEGSFDIKIYKSKTNTGYAVQLRFRIPQHERDTKLIEVLMKYFGSGVIEKHTQFPAVTLVIVKFSHIIEKVIPFFELYPLIGIKQKDFLDWCKVARLMNGGSHLTIEGLNLIRTIKDGMNKGRPKK
uniref:LAGLIDADG endonuclease n=1 Tax=Pappia fissilis TaxID=1040649 RepID=UPI002A83330D|nr:LAGLIDADG endonuclease [Pappia fissilis]WOX61315.1 LAGLIDADG endonuclease [Pappia fissilis]